MAEFKNVTVVREANVYFAGGVTSRTVFFADGAKKTLGIMQPGEYTFTTDVAELMEIQSGELDLKIAGSELWDRIGGGESFQVPARTSFTVRVHTLSDYCCSFLA
jgi:hypothetical protein